MEVLYDRVAGLDIGKASLTACVRTPGARRGRHTETRTFKTTTGSLVVLRDWFGRSGGDDRGDGVDLDVLEGAVLLLGGGDGGLAPQRCAHEGGAGSQDRRARCGVDRWSTGC